MTLIELFWLGFISIEIGTFGFFIIAKLDQLEERLDKKEKGASE